MLRISKMLREIIEEREKTSISSVAKAIEVDRGSLYRALKAGGNPEGKTIEKILDHFGYEIHFTKSRKREVRKGKQWPSKSKKKGGGSDVDL